MNDSDNFISALENHNLNAIRKIPKADLRNHFVLGGSRQYIKQKTGYDIEPVKYNLHSMDEMHMWSNTYMNNRFHSKEMRKLLIEAAFAHARDDGVTVLEIGDM